MAGIPLEVMVFLPALPPILELSSRPPPPSNWVGCRSHWKISRSPKCFRVCCLWTYDLACCFFFFFLIQYCVFFKKTFVNFLPLWLLVLFKKVSQVCLQSVLQNLGLSVTWSCLRQFSESTEGCGSFKRPSAGHCRRSWGGSQIQASQKLPDW